MSLQKKDEKAKKYQLQRKLENKMLTTSSSDSEHLFTPVKSDNLAQLSRVPMSTPPPIPNRA